MSDKEVSQSFHQGIKPAPGIDPIDEIAGEVLLDPEFPRFIKADPMEALKRVQLPPAIKQQIGQIENTSGDLFAQRLLEIRDQLQNHQQ
jgi:hypothetical protein